MGGGLLIGPSQTLSVDGLMLIPVFSLRVVITIQCACGWENVDSPDCVSAISPILYMSKRDSKGWRWWKWPSVPQPNRGMAETRNCGSDSSPGLLPLLPCQVWRRPWMAEHNMSYNRLLSSVQTREVCVRELWSLLEYILTANLFHPLLPSFTCFFLPNHRVMGI